MAGALDGIRVIEAGQWIAAPFCTSLLADLGADVIKVEKPKGGDDQRHSPPFTGGEGALFTQVNRNKRGVTLDLGAETGRAAFRALVGEADVLIDNLRPGALAANGLGYELLMGANPGLICCAVSGYGQTGPFSGTPGMDLIAQAMSGIMMLNADAAGRPTKIPFAIADLSTGLFAAVGILAALTARGRTGKGQLVDVSLLDSVLAMLPLEIGTVFATGAEPARLSPHHSRNAAPYQVFRSRDGWVAVVAAGQMLWERLCGLLGRVDLVSDPRFVSNGDRIARAAELEAILEPIFQAHPTSHWIEMLSPARIPVAPVMGLTEILAHRHVQERGAVREAEGADGVTRPYMVAPIWMSDTPVSLRRPSPRLGEHNGTATHG